MRRQIDPRSLLPVIIAVMIVTAAAGFGSGWWRIGDRSGKEDDRKLEIVSVMNEGDIGEETPDDPWLEMQKLITANYESDKLMSFKGLMKLVDDNGVTQEVVEKMRFEYDLFQGEYHYLLGHLECVRKSGLFILADHDTRTILIQETQSDSGAGNELLGLENLRNALEQKTGGIKISQAGGSKILTVNNIQDPRIQGYQVFYDPVTYRINKMLIGMIRLNPLGETAIPAVTDPGEVDENTVATYSYYLEITYESIAKKNLDLKFKPEDKFLRGKGKKAELTPAFKNYTVLN